MKWKAEVRYCKDDNDNWRDRLYHFDEYIWNESKILKPSSNNDLGFGMSKFDPNLYHNFSIRRIMFSKIHKRAIQFHSCYDNAFHHFWDNTVFQNHLQSILGKLRRGANEVISIYGCMDWPATLIQNFTEQRTENYFKSPELLYEKIMGLWNIISN